ncbi:hypothetical protein ABZ502_17715 [Streptomyces abikoensis]|uniref:hypothetical protein n=1 Tax=Streptomyces abikoensis TaxID=97398 RepID=UPI0033F6CC2F
MSNRVTSPSTTAFMGPARKRLYAQMATLFSKDGGMGGLVEYNGRPDMTETDKTLQTQWARALIAVHGRERSAAVYSAYASARQREEADTADPVGSFDRMVLTTRPLGYEQAGRDIHGFMCVVCGAWFPTLLIDDFDAACTKCARENSSPEEAKPLWKAYSHSNYAFPGFLAEDLPNGETAITVRYARDGEQRNYITGDAGLLIDGATSLPGFTRHSTATEGESRDRINFHVHASTHHLGRAFDVRASFVYDPDKDGSEPHGYGFRLTRAQVTHDGVTRQHTDLYGLIGQLVTGLYSGAGR